MARTIRPTRRQHKIMARPKPKAPPVRHSQIPKYGADDRTKIAIIMSGSWGDCCNSTLMFEPLRNHFNNLVLDIYTSTYYESAFHNNPHINQLVKFEANSKQSALHLIHVIPDFIKSCGYTHILNPHPMVNPGSWTSVTYPELGTNLIYAWVRALEDLKVNVTLPLKPLIKISPTEQGKVEGYVKQIPEFHAHKRNLMETHGESGQTQWDHNWTVQVCDLLCSKDEMVFISRREIGNDIVSLRNKYPKLVHFVGELSIREASYLYDKCDRFFSVSSGLSNACNTMERSKTVDWIEVVNSPAASSAPIRTENKTFWYKTDLAEFLQFVTTKLVQ